MNACVEFRLRQKVNVLEITDRKKKKQKLLDSTAFFFKENTFRKLIHPFRLIACCTDRLRLEK